MEYTAEIIRQQIEANGGDVRDLMSMTFNNSYTKTFFSEDFSYDMIDEVNQTITFIEKDVRGQRLKIIKPIMYIESLVFAMDGLDKSSYDPMFVHG